MLNLVYYHVSPYTIRKNLEELPDPPKEYITVQYLFCGICGGDYSVFCGRRTHYPVSLGHEFVGLIVKCGSNCSEYAVGDIVVSDFNFRCNKCEYCISGMSHLCIYNDVKKMSNRGFSKYGNLHKSYLYKIPKFDYLPKACLIEPLSCVLHACDSFSFETSTNVLINGCGSIGMLFVFYLIRVLKCLNVQVIEPNALKLQKILKHFPVTSYVVDNNSKFDLIIECSNSLEGMKNILDLCSHGQRLCIMSHLYGMDTSFVYETICKKELRPYFPLRNGEIKNIHYATDYIDSYWTESDNDMIGIYDNVADAFQHKTSTTFNKQIIKMS